MSDTTPLPDNIPDVATLVNSFKEAQATITRLSQEKAALAAKQTTPAAPAEGEKAPGSFLNAGKPAADASKLPSFNDLNIEFMSNQGKLTEATKAKITAVGWNPQDIEENLRNKAITQTKTAAELLGGPEEFKKFAEWVETLPPAKANALHKALQGNDWEASLLGYNQLRLKPIANNEPSQNQRQAAANTQGAPEPKGLENITEDEAFANQKAEIEATKDPRYKTNKDGYRDQVYRQRLASVRHKYKDSR